MESVRGVLVYFCSCCMHTSGGDTDDLLPLVFITSRSKTCLDNSPFTFVSQSVLQCIFLVTSSSHPSILSFIHYHTCFYLQWKRGHSHLWCIFLDWGKKIRVCGENPTIQLRVEPATFLLCLLTVVGLCCTQPPLYHWTFIWNIIYYCLTPTIIHYSNSFPFVIRYITETEWRRSSSSAALAEASDPAMEWAAQECGSSPLETTITRVTGVLIKTSRGRLQELTDLEGSHLFLRDLIRMCYLRRQGDKSRTEARFSERRCFRGRFSLFCVFSKLVWNSIDFSLDFHSTASVQLAQNMNFMMKH